MSKETSHFPLFTFTFPTYHPRMPPTLFQKKMLWAALTAFSFVLIGAVVFLIGWLGIGAISFLQPVLIPVAIAAILAYLLEPVVRFLTMRRVSRTLAVVIVFLAVTLIIGGILIWIVPAIWRQGQQLYLHLPEYSASTQKLLDSTVTEARRIIELPIFQKPDDEAAETGLTATYVTQMVNEGVLWLNQKLPEILGTAGTFLKKSIGGFLGVFGFLLSLILVPIFLFFFLKESPSIGVNWSNYLPLRASPLKSEIVSLLSEINTYLINFFRGQLIVSLIDGLLIGASLLIMGLEFGLLIGLLVGVLGLIPYIGMMICWIPAVLIAAAQFGDWWHPLVVTIIFIVANNLDGMLIAPKIVGESVGLHPLTVIFSVLAWSLILGGLLGALLAVPLTATLKVVLKRYFWDRPASENTPAPIPTTP